MSYPEPSKIGHVHFTPPGSKLECSTFYSIWGDLDSSSDTKPLICVHGGPGVPSHYFAPLGLLHQQFKIPVITYDQVGCGRSTRLPEKKGDVGFWSFEHFIAELSNLLAVLGIREYHIYGHSWGGLIATEFALTQPPGMRKLILASSPAKIQTRVAVTRRQRVQIPGNVGEIMERCEHDGTTSSDEYRAAMMQYMKRHMCRLDPLPEPFVESVKSSAEDDTVSSTIHGGITVPGPLGSYDIVPRLHEITAKTVRDGVLIMNGEYDGAQDEVVRPFFTRIEARVKWVKFMNSSHMPFLEETEKFIEETGNFLLYD